MEQTHSIGELIPIQEKDGAQAVSARLLYQYLGATERFNNWFDRQLKYGFAENEDFVGCKVFNTLANQEIQDYAMTLNMAKEVCMIQRNKKGRKARQYFIEKEKELKMLQKQAIPSYQIQDPIERAQKWIEEQKVVKALEEQKHSLELANSKLKPKADFADAAFKATESFVDIGQAAKILSLPFGRNTLFKKLRDDGIFFNDKNEPKQKFIDAKYFKVTQLPPIDCGEAKPPIIPIKVLVTQKGLAYINMKYNDNKQQTTFKQVIK